MQCHQCSTLESWIRCRPLSCWVEVKASTDKKHANQNDKLTTPPEISRYNTPLIPAYYVVGLSTQCCYFWSRRLCQDDTGSS